MTLGVPVSILDLVDVRDGGTAETAFQRSLEVARRAEGLGYHRYWFAEHHNTATVASSTPAVAIA